jgi:hypothetical protein
MTGAAVPPARPPAPSHDDGLYDAIALIEAAAREDALAVAVLGRCADRVAVVAALVQIIGNEWCPACIANGEFREWALSTAEGGSS